MKIDVNKLIKSIAIPLIAGGASAFLTRNSMETFEALNQPPLSPPGWLFPIVWTILYILMGISLYLILQSDADDETVKSAQRIFYFQLALNFLWPLLFFNMGWYLLAFVELIVLWLAVIAMIKQFAETSKLAAYLNIPYLIWLTFAAYLNFGVWWLNRWIIFTGNNKGGDAPPFVLHLFSWRIYRFFYILCCKITVIILIK